MSQVESRITELKNEEASRRFTIGSLEKFREKELPVLTSLPSKLEDVLKVTYPASGLQSSWFQSVKIKALVAIKSGHLVVRQVPGKRSRFGTTVKRTAKVGNEILRVLSLEHCRIEESFEKSSPREFSLITRDGFRVVFEATSQKQKSNWVAFLQSEIDSLCIGKKVDSLTDYVLGSTMGKGHFGAVRFLYNPYKNVKLALKILNIEKAVSTETKYNIRERVIMEQINLLKDSVVADLDSNALPRLFASFTINKSLFLMSEAFMGGTLLDLLKAKKHLTEDVVRFIMYDFINGLKCLHSIDIAHRDIKPENIMFDSNCRVKIIDFGLSREFWTIERYRQFNEADGNHNNFAVSNLKTEQKRYIKTYDCVGTSYYMAPEMIRGLGHEVSVDFWQAGCLMFELLFGYPLFHGKTDEEIEGKIGSYAPISLPKSDVSEDAEDFLLSLLIREPCDRLGFKNGAADLLQHDFFNAYKIDVTNPPVELQEYVTETVKKNTTVNTQSENEAFFDFLKSQGFNLGLDNNTANIGAEHRLPKRFSFSNIRNLKLSAKKSKDIEERKWFLERLGVNYMYYKLPIEGELSVS